MTDTVRRSYLFAMTDAADPTSFEDVALPLIPDVSRFAFSLTRDADEADDLVQETYLRAFRAWHTFTPGTNVRSWLFTICKNTFRRRFMREKVRPEIEKEAVGDDDAMPIVMSHVKAEKLGLGDLFDRLDVGPALERGMDALPELFREIVALVDLEGFSYHEAAEILEIPVGTVRSRLFRARRRLQDFLIEQARDMGLATEQGGDS
jgi:RNA polymerase sigma-70 factor (ECF subfamily)